MGDEEAGALVVGVVGALFVGVGVDGDVVGLAFDDNEGGLAFALVLHGAPDDEVGAGVTVAAFAGEGDFLGNLVEGVAVFVDEGAEVGLADVFLGGFIEPFPANVAEDFVVFAEDGERVGHGGNRR